MKAFLLICPLVLLGGCATPAPPASPTAREPKAGPDHSLSSAEGLSGGAPAARNPKADPRYPFSEIEGVYDAVLDGMTEKYFSNFPELDRQHTKPMREFIVTAYPRDRFVKEIVRNEYLARFERARREPAYRETKEFQDAFTVMVSVSVSMAKMIIGGQQDIYVAKFVDKDPVKAELFGMAATDDERQFVSWVSGEVPAEEAVKQAGDQYRPTPGDRVFAFCSPQATWTDLCGRAGYLVVRDGKIVQVIVTMMN